MTGGTFASRVFSVCKWFVPFPHLFSRLSFLLKHFAFSALLYSLQQLFSFPSCCSAGLRHSSSGSCFTCVVAIPPFSLQASSQRQQWQFPPFMFSAAQNEAHWETCAAVLSASRQFHRAQRARGRPMRVQGNCKRLEHMKVGAVNPSSSSAGMAATKSWPQSQKLTVMEGKQQPPFFVIDRNVSQTVWKHVLIFSCQQRELTQENRSSLRTVTAYCFRMCRERGHTTADLVSHIHPRWTPAPDHEVGSYVLHNLHMHAGSRFGIQSAVTNSRKRTMYELSRRIM